MNMTGVKGVQEYTRLFRDFRESEVGLPAESVCLSSYSVLGILDLILHVRFPTFLQKETSTSFAWKDWVRELMGSLLAVAGQEG
jgi:hypothetical protein